MSSCNRKHTNPTAHIHSSEGQNMTVLICTDTRLKNNIRVSDLSLISDTDIRYFCHICLFFIFLYEFKRWTLTGENKPDLLSACLYSCAVKDPASPQSRTRCAAAVQRHLPDRNAKFDGGHERFYGKQLC